MTEAYSLARLQERAVAALQNKPKPRTKIPMQYTGNSTVRNTGPYVSTSSKVPSFQEQAGLFSTPALPKLPVPPPRVISP